MVAVAFSGIHVIAVRFCCRIFLRLSVGNARFFSASPAQPPWYLHDLIPFCARAHGRAAGASLSNAASVFSTAAVDL